MNMNDFAREITLQEGKKKSLPIGQVKEVIRLVLTKMAGLSPSERNQVIERYGKG